MSPLRAHQVLGIVVSPVLYCSSLPFVLVLMYVVDTRADDWTGIEIGLFEEGHERFGKDFYAIAEQVPTYLTFRYSACRAEP